MALTELPARRETVLVLVLAAGAAEQMHLALLALAGTVAHLVVAAVVAAVELLAALAGEGPGVKSL